MVLAMLLMLALGSGLDACTSQSPQAWGPTIDGLRVAIYPASSGDLPSGGTEFYLAFQNVGDTDFILNLGHMMAMGRLMEPYFVQLILTDSAGRTWQLQFMVRRAPHPTAISGRFEDFVVGLRAGSTYTLRVSLGEYWSPATKEGRIRWAAGRYRIRARFDGREKQYSKSLSLLNFWTGSVESNVLEFNLQGDVAQGQDMEVLSKAIVGAMRMQESGWALQHERARYGELTQEWTDGKELVVLSVDRKASADDAKTQLNKMALSVLGDAPPQRPADIGDEALLYSRDGLTDNAVLYFRKGPSTVTVRGRSEFMIVRVAQLVATEIR